MLKRRDLRAMNALLNALDKYVDRVVEDPGTIRHVVDDVLRDSELAWLMIIASQEILSLYRERPGELISAVVSDVEMLKDRFKSLGIDLSGALEDFIEHDVLKLNLLLKKPLKLIQIITEFITRYTNEFEEYIRVYLAIVILLYALSKTGEPDKLRIMAKYIKQYAEILDSYTATFELMSRDEVGEAEIHSIHRSPETLRKVLEID